MSDSDIRSADSERGWDRLTFPPPWWELPVIVGVCASIGHFASKSETGTVAWIGTGIVIFLFRYVDGERAVLHRLDEKFAQMQDQIASLAATVNELQRKRVSRSE